MIFICERDDTKMKRLKKNPWKLQNFRMLERKLPKFYILYFLLQVSVATKTVIFGQNCVFDQTNAPIEVGLT